MRVALVLLIVGAAAASARAEDYADDGDAYCAFTKGVAAADSALLFSPQIFLDFGVVNGNDVTTGAGGITSAPPTERLTFGARYSLVAGLTRGIINKQHAAADCARYRAATQLTRFVIDNREGVSPAALDAKLAVLRAAVPRAQEILRNLRASVERSHATVDELEATQVRVDELQTALNEAEAQRAGLPERARMPSPDELLRRHREADEALMHSESMLRLTEAFDVSVRGGWDQFFGLRDQLPLFGVISFSINPGILYAPFAQSEAARGRAKALRLENDGVEQRAELMSSRLHALLASEQRRLGDVRVLIADVQSRIHALDSIESDRLRRFREAMWFDWVKLKAEQEFLRVHVGELQTTLGEGG